MTTQAQVAVEKMVFGKTNTQVTGYYGRQLQYSSRLEF
jgi:hypothetical protein